MANTSAIAAGVAFVALAAINMVVMLEASQPSCSAATRNRLIAVHRTSGYLFAILLCIMAYSMSQRLAGVGITGHLPTHLVLHIVLVLVLVPLTMAHSMCDLDKVLPEFAGHTTRCALWKTWH
jgi:hypothetical protein